MTQDYWENLYQLVRIYHRLEWMRKITRIPSQPGWFLSPTVECPNLNSSNLSVDDPDPLGLLRRDQQDQFRRNLLPELPWQFRNLTSNFPKKNHHSFITSKKPNKNLSFLTKPNQNYQKLFVVCKTGVTISWTVAHALLHCDYLLGFVLPCKFDLGHCRHVVRRTPEEGRRGRGRRGRSASGERTTLSLSNFFILCTWSCVVYVLPYRRLFAFVPKGVMFCVFSFHVS